MSAANTKWFSYGAWGEERDGNTWGYQAPTSNYDPEGTTERGFTGHEMLAETGLIHMNGRVFDPLLARFLSPDPHIQAPANAQNYNRYSYVLNNPLSMSDPSGYFFNSIFNAIRNFFKDNWKTITAVLLTAALVSALGPAGLGLPMWLAGGIAGAAGGFVVGGVRGAIAGAVAGAILGAQFGGELNSFSDLYSLAGDISRGTSRILSEFDMIKNAFVQLRELTVGGTEATVDGGLFANGAATSAYSHLFATSAPPADPSLTEFLEYYEQKNAADHARRTYLRDYASQLSLQEMAGQITSLDAMVLVSRRAVTLHAINARIRNEEISVDLVVEDMGLVLAGQADVLTEDFTYYVGFNDSGFHQNFRDGSPQVRHTIGGLIAGYNLTGVIGNIGMDWREFRAGIQERAGFSWADVRINSEAPFIGGLLRETPGRTIDIIDLPTELREGFSQ